jgi:hypothetical protein
LRGEWGGPGKTESKDESDSRQPAHGVHSLRRRFGEKTCRDRSHRDNPKLLAIGC